MIFYSTNDSTHRVDSATAVLSGLAPDGGLYLPEYIPQLPDSLLAAFPEVEPETLVLELLAPYLEDALPREEIAACISKALSFPAPLVRLEDSLSVLELFHGPTCAFKDFGARFMAQLFSRLRDPSQELTVLVATSGDTGGAVAAGFHGVPGTRVVVLYPSKKISQIQELQLTTWGDNISALEIEGSFDDCQALVKKAFVDPSLQSALSLSSANSINISRLLPQMLYYALGIQQAKQYTPQLPCVCTVPSGNLGNISAGLLAQQMGIPISGFFCAVNANRTMATYCKGAPFAARESLSTLSNAMDVGNPSNFPRMFQFAGASDAKVRASVLSESFSDEQTLHKMQETYEHYQYLCDPHTAVGLLGAKDARRTWPEAHHIVLATAHPAKFADVCAKAQLPPIPLPEQLARLDPERKHSIKLSKSYAEFQSHLLAQYC